MSKTAVPWIYLMNEMTDARAAAEEYFEAVNTAPHIKALLIEAFIDGRLSVREALE